MTGNPAASDRRQAARRRKLGPGAACALCAERRPEALVLQLHHVALAVNEPTVIAQVCLNCHAAVQERLRGIGLEEWAPASDTWLERHSAVLLGTADFLECLVGSLRTASGRTVRFAERLDIECPTWRTWPEAAP